MCRAYDNLGREIEITGFGVDSIGKYFTYKFVSRYEIPDSLMAYYDSIDKDKFIIINF